MTGHKAKFVLLAVLLAFVVSGPGSAAQEYCGSLEEPVTEKENFSFAVWGDPQVAHPNPRHGPDQNFERKAETANPRLQKTVRLTNELAPEFVMTVGDNIHGSGQVEHYRTLVDLVEPLRSPLFMAIGNHDWTGRADRYTNNVDDRPFSNFLWAQKQVGAPELINYSFDAGKWHFVVFAQPGGGGGGISSFFHEHPEYLEWLERDLRRNSDRPTMFFTHHPLLPVGRRQFQYYNLDAAGRGKLVDAVTKNGDVRYAFFGHVHNTVGAVPDISWRYRGTTFTMMPNAANVVRKADYHETTTSSWGTGIVTVRGEEIESITFHTLADEQIPFRPDMFARYDDDRYAFLRPGSALPADETVRNGGFEQPLTDAWFLNYLLPHKIPPLQQREVVSGDAPQGDRYLRLYTRSKSSPGDGASFMTADVRQAVSLPDSDSWPRLSLQYRIPSNRYRGRKACSGYVLVRGFEPDARRPEFALLYGLGRTFRHYNLRRIPGPREARLGASVRTDRWTELTLNVREDYRKHLSDPTWTDMNLERMVVTIGSYNENYAPLSRPAEVELQVDDVQCSFADQAAEPSAGFKTTKKASLAGERPLKVLHYTFNDESAADSSGFRNRGRLSGGEFLEGAAGKALELQGEGGVDVSKSGSLNPANNPIALEALVKSRKEDGVILARGAGVHGYALVLQDGRPQFCIRRDNEPTDLEADVDVTGEWTHIAAVLSPDKTMKLYVNGELAASRDIPGLIQQNPYRPMRIGGSPAASVGDYPRSLGFTGLLDDVRIYRGAPGAESIAKRARELLPGQ